MLAGNPIQLDKLDFVSDAGLGSDAAGHARIEVVHGGADVNSNWT
jgi:hypothetical protein